VDHVVAGIGLDESGRVDAVEAVAAAEVALEKAEDATGGGGAARDPEAQGLLREAERVLAKAEVESERTDDDVELGGGENGAVRRGAGGSGAGMENNREYDRWYSDTPPWVLATCAGVGAGLVLIVFQTVCQGVGKGCEGSSGTVLGGRRLQEAAAGQVRSRRDHPGVTGLYRPLVTLDD
jgi:hypothetical protein